MKRYLSVIARFLCQTQQKISISLMLARLRACGRGAVETWLYESSGFTTRRKQNQEESLPMESNLCTVQPMWMKMTYRRSLINARYSPQRSSNDAFKVSSHQAPGLLCQIACSVASGATILTVRRCSRSCDLRMCSVRGGSGHYTNVRFAFQFVAFVIESMDHLWFVFRIKFTDCLR